MMKRIDDIVRVAAITGIVTVFFSVEVLADVVTVSSLPGSATTALSASAVVSKASGVSISNAGNKTAETRIVTALTSLAASEKNKETVVSRSVSDTAASASASSKTVPVVDATSAVNVDNSSYSETTVSTSTSTNTQSAKQVSVVEAVGGADDKAAQQPTTSEVGFCVVLSSNPTGTMKDITG